MEQTISKESAALIKTLLYEEIAIAQENGNLGEVNKALDAINEFNRLLDREYIGLKKD